MHERDDEAGTAAAADEPPATEPSATARLYQALGITSEEIGELREVGGGDLEVDVSFRARGGDIRATATVRMSRKPARSTLARLEVATDRPWLTRVDADLLEQLARPAIMAAARALHNRTDAAAATEPEGDDSSQSSKVAAAHAALASPGLIAVRAKSDDCIAGVAARVAVVNALPRDHFPAWRRRPVSRLWIEEERRLHAENDARAAAGNRRRRITASEQRSYERARRAEIREAQRRGYLDARQQLTSAGLVAIHARALAEIAANNT